MNVDKLWAPWREKYVTGIYKKRKGCVFCKILKEKRDRQNFILMRTQYSFSVLNIYPYNNGHTMVLPLRHTDDISKLTRMERDDLLDLLDFTKSQLGKGLKPAGFNIGINLGRVAGAGFPGHLHVHIVPRWKGDVNFMPVTGQTKVISQSLSAVYDLLKKNIES